jgi:hypothetical protein
MIEILINIRKIKIDLLVLLYAIFLKLYLCKIDLFGGQIILNYVRSKYFCFQLYKFNCFYFIYKNLLIMFTQIHKNYQS